MTPEGRPQSGADGAQKSSPFTLKRTIYAVIVGAVIVPLATLVADPVVKIMATQIAIVQGTVVATLIGSPFPTDTPAPVPTETPTTPPTRDPRTGTPPPKNPTPTATLTPTSTPRPCQYTPKVLLKVGDDAIQRRQATVKLRAGPGAKATNDHGIEPNAVLRVLDGPKCEDHRHWFKVRAADGRTGWLAEAGNDAKDYWLVKKA